MRGGIRRIVSGSPVVGALVAGVLIVGVLTMHAAPAAPGSADPFATRCESLSRQDLTALTAAPARILSAGVREGPGTVEICEIAGYAHPQSQFTLRVPKSWNAKLLFQGCGGFCGVVYIDRADDALARGYATVATNMGHVGSPLEALWALDNPSAELDFAYRATHRVAVAAKAILAAFRHAPERSYFRGCSTGGRQGLMAAQRFPEDFDAIIAGAPVLNYIHGSGVQLLWSVLVPTAASAGFRLDATDVDILGDFVLERCDGQDGVRDGVIDNPRRCEIDWSRPVCDTKGRCLDRRAIDSARVIYLGPTDEAGEPLFRGPELGSEPYWTGAYVAEGASPPLFREFIFDLFRYLAFDDDPGVEWTPDIDAIGEYVARSEAQHRLFSALDTDLDRFRKRGGKLLLYHGWQDRSVVPEGTLQYLRALDERYAGSRSAELATTLRAFMVPGMEHCRGGSGPWQVDWLSVLEEWERSDRAPDVVVASDPEDREDGKGRTRRIFAYPSAPGPVREPGAQSIAK